MFEVVFTVDRDFAELSDTVPYPIGIVILAAGSTDYEVLLPHVEAVKTAVASVSTGQVLRIGG